MVERIEIDTLHDGPVNIKEIDSIQHSVSYLENRYYVVMKDIAPNRIDVWYEIDKELFEFLEGVFSQ